MIETDQPIKAAIAAEFARTGPPEGFPGFPTVPAGRYTSDDFFALEQQHLWPRVWVPAGRVEDIAEPGDYVTFAELGRPVVIVRGADREIRAFYNTCQHRGAQIVRDAHGNARSLRCLYHSWTYDITSGEVVHIPEEYDFRGLDRSDHALTQIRCDTYGGWVFVNEDPDAEPLRHWFGPVFDALDSLEGETLRTICRREATMACNWKIAAEAFLEIYHFRFIHTAAGPTPVDSRGTLITLWPNGASRMITPYSRTTCAALGMRDWTDWQHHRDPRFADVPGAPDLIRSTSTAYNGFPNLVTRVFAHGLPFICFWPIDRRTTKVTWVHYGVKDWDGDTMPEHWQAQMDAFDRIMEEDRLNMEPMQRSVESPGMRGMTFGYQERRCWQFHEQVDRTIGIERIPEALRVPQLLGPWTETPAT
jgi:phenylpropionate dioxygenase-like ring-hydroxylating dioxygenase large terminal subunit